VEERGRSELLLDHFSDEELVGRCARGDRHAMDLLVSRYHSKLLDFAFRHLRNRDLAADVAQATLVRVFECAGSYRLTSSFKTWIYAIALNLIRDHCRRRLVRNESLSSELESDESSGQSEIADSGSSPEQLAIEGAVSSEIWDAVGALGENPRMAIILRFRHGLTYDEIAETMGVPSGTVKSWIHYALKALRRSLSKLECEV
jgi:RNA polymerase sigma-70 factor (ECF subfamily)